MDESDTTQDTNTTGVQNITRAKRQHDTDTSGKSKKIYISQDTLSNISISESETEEEADCLFLSTHQNELKPIKYTSAENLNKLSQRAKNTAPLKMATKNNMDKINSENSELKHKIQSVEAELAAVKAQMAAYRQQQQQKATEVTPQTTAKQIKEVQQPTTTNNRFDVLHINDNYDTNMDDEDDDNSPFITVKKTIKNRNKTSPSQPQQTLNKTTTTQQKVAKEQPKKTSPTTSPTATKASARPPPIHIHNQQIGDTITLMKGSKIEKFNIKRISQSKHTLLIEDLDSYNSAKQVLKEVETPYFTYTPKVEKPKTIVLKGLHENEDTNEIKNLIEEHGIQIINVTQLKTKHSKRNEQRLPLYIIQCAPDTNMGNIYKITSLNYQRVSWEPLKKSEVIMQCHQCQRFGHAAANCNLKYRCVKCKEDHEPGKCQIIEKVDKNAVYCINCQTTGHPASYKGCPYYQATLERLQQKIKEKRNQNHTPAIIPITKKTYVNETNGSFADMLKGGKQQQQPQTPSATTQQSSPTVIAQLTNKIDSLAEIVKQQGEQLATLLNLISELTK